MVYKLYFVIFILFSSFCQAQTSYINPALANSTWPIFHANNDATASNSDIGPGAIKWAQTVDSLTSKRFGRPSVSPWTVMQAPYSDGSQAIITTPLDGIAKYVIKNNQLQPVSFLKLDRGMLDFDWGIILTRNGIGISTEKRNNRFVLFGDASNNPSSPLEIKGYIPVNEEKYGKVSAHLTLAYDGSLIVLTDKNILLAINIASRSIISSFVLPSSGGISVHNSFPIDETGRIFLSTQKTMLAVDWNGDNFQLAWTANYDMRGPGCENVSEDRSFFREAIAVARGDTCTGSGTTPTLIGTANNGIVFIVDGHSPKNNLVAFWRNNPPVGWKPLRNPKNPTQILDPRIAGIFELPYSTPLGDGYTAENSPATLGYGIIVAQWAGFDPDGDAPAGVQRVNWNPTYNRFELAWVNPSVRFNGVPTIACQKKTNCQTYGMGRYDEEYRYISLDYQTGNVTGNINLGSDDRVLDQGNNHSIANDGSIVYSGKYAMIRLGGDSLPFNSMPVHSIDKKNNSQRKLIGSQLKARQNNDASFDNNRAGNIRSRINEFRQRRNEGN